MQTNKKGTLEPGCLIVRDGKGGKDRRISLCEMMYLNILDLAAILQICSNSMCPQGLPCHWDYPG
jgi:hypothetical protein